MKKKQPTITEPTRDIPVSKRFDVLVAGGGMAGIAAAVAAARLGAKVGLVEKQSALGGLATLGNVAIWLPLCDGKGNQVIGGLGEELLKRSVASLNGNPSPAVFSPVPPCWLPGGNPADRAQQRYQTRFNPAEYLLALEQLIVDSGIELLYDTRACALHCEQKKITHVMIENKSGRSALSCRTVIDATGDADLCYLVGEPTESLNSNVPAAWFYLLRNDRLHLHSFSNPYSPNGTRKDGAVGPFFRGDDGAGVTAQIIQSRNAVRTRLAEVRKKYPEDSVQLIKPATIACLRMTRRLAAPLPRSTGQPWQTVETTIGLTGDWRRPGPVFALPYQSLCAVETENLLVAGRCLSVPPALWDVTRAIPACVVSGEAAGTAAALAVQFTAGQVRKLTPPRLQAQLRRQHVILDMPESGNGKNKK